MKIGEVSRRSGFSPETLRYYDKIGLLDAVGRDAAGRRDYDGHDIEQLMFIRRAKSAGFSLDDIRVLLRLRSAPNEARRQVLGLTQAKLAEIEHKISSLTAFKDELTRLSHLCCSDGGDSCPILSQLSDTEHSHA